MIRTLSKDFDNSILDDSIKTGFLRAEDCMKIERLLNRKVILILKSKRTEKRDTLQLISNYIPEYYSQAQLNNLNTINHKCKNIIIFEGLPSSDTNFMNNFLGKIHMLKRDYILINEDIGKLNASDFISYIVCDLLNKGTLIFEIIGDTLDEAYDMLAKMYMSNVSSKVTMEDSIKLIKSSVDGIITVNTENNKEISIANIIINTPADNL